MVATFRTDDIVTVAANALLLQCCKMCVFSRMPKLNNCKLRRLSDISKAVFPFGKNMDD